MGCPVKGLQGCEQRAALMALLTASPLTLPGFINANSSPIWLVMIMRSSGSLYIYRNKGKQPFGGGGGEDFALS